MESCEPRMTFVGASLLAIAVGQSTSVLAEPTQSRAGSLPQGEVGVTQIKMPLIARSGAFFTAWRNSAIAGQQCRLLAPWTAWQLVQLFRRRETIDLRFLVHDLRLVATRGLHGGFLTRLVVTGRAARAGVFAAG